MINPRLLLIGLLCLGPVLGIANPRLPGFFTDHMVLQRQMPIPIWGWAEPGEVVSVTLGDAAPVQATANADGRWDVKLPAREASSEGLTLKVSTPSASRAVSDVLIGEVWLCSGQSNMEWSVAASLNPAEEIAAANYPEIRQMKVDHLTSGVPKDDVASTWKVCSPETAGRFTAAGYYMARELHRELGVPVGLLNISWGGTRIEPWTPLEGFEATPTLSDIVKQVSRTLPHHELYRTALQQHIESTDQWLATATDALAKKETVPLSPEFPASSKPLTSHTSPTTLFNAMMNPVVGYGIRGAIWYQGESNHSEGMLYFEKKKAMVAGWRELWGLGDFPFYFVQIAPYQYGKESPGILPVFWEAQAKCLDIPNTGMVVINDVGNINDIHPKNKQEVGRRLSLQALKNQYGKKDLVASGPVFESLSIDGEKLRLKFSETAGGLKSRDGKALTHFEMIGEQAAFVEATAEIEGGDTIVLSSDKIKEPSAMRFGWHKLAEPNLCNGAGLPPTPFRAGEVPKFDYLALNVEDAGEYELIYDLDLKQLGSAITYQVDRSAEITSSFDRIGYFMELLGNDGELQWVWVSLDAFTDDIKKIGVPTFASGAQFQKAAKNLSIQSNLSTIASGKGINGNIEFWPGNYGPGNSGNVAGASTQVWDFGDDVSGFSDGYGSMQIHNTTAKQTIFALNQWRAGPGADLGIGNSSSDPRSKDWTFASNARKYETARLRILIRKSAQ